MDTGRCNYVWLSQPALRDIAEGDVLSLELRHFDLTAVVPGQAHVALLFDDEVEWETHVDVPGPANVLEVEWEAGRDLPAGGRVELHLHNHGQNTWSLVSVQTLVAEEQN